MSDERPKRRAKDRRTSDAPVDLTKEREAFVRTFLRKGVELTCVDEAGRKTVNRVEPLQAPFAFRGDWQTSCRLLDGPVKVFNVMTRRGRFSANVEIVSSTSPARAAPGETLIAVALPGLDAWILDGPVADVGRAVLVRIKNT